MRNPMLSAFTIDELLEEIRGRFQAFAGVPVTRMAVTVEPPPPVQRIELNVPALGEVLPKGIVKAEPIPGRFNRDGSPRRLLTSGIPEGLEERLRVTPASLEGRNEFDGRTQFIVKGADREALATSFINQWQSEIEEMEAQLALAETGSDLERTLQDGINQRRQNIALRSESAFGGLSAEEVRARNIADNGNVMDAPSEAGVAGRGVRFTMASGLKEWDAPLWVTVVSTTIPYLMAREMQRRIEFDPICGHVQDRLTVVHVETPAGPATSLTFATEPSVIYRMGTIWAALCAREKMDPSVLYRELENVTQNHHVHFMTDPDSYCGAWTAYIRSQFPNRPMRSDDPVYMSRKRIVRILNPDFQEREAPSSFYDQTDGENPMGRQLRPHVDTRAAWAGVEAGPGVFPMNDDEEDISEVED